MRVSRSRILTRTYTQNNQFFMYICKAQYSMIYNFSEDNKYISWLLFVFGMVNYIKVYVFYFRLLWYHCDRGRSCTNYLVLWLFLFVHHKSAERQKTTAPCLNNNFIQQQQEGISFFNPFMKIRKIESQKKNNKSRS